MEFSMKILGVEAFFHDTSACVLVDGKIKYAVQEERLTRNKLILGNYLIKNHPKLGLVEIVAWE
jgi:predicted NodU family carbamoyl transferase